MSSFSVTKNYSPENGLSATFRQWRAQSHCRFIHGYALGVEVTFECDEADLDENGWVLNFGGLKAFKAWLCDTFDHKTLVAQDDPEIETFRYLARQTSIGQEELLLPTPLIQLVEVERTGCEGFAKMIGEWLIENVLADPALRGRAVQLTSVRVYEHTGNSATWSPL